MGALLCLSSIDHSKLLLQGFKKKLLQQVNICCLYFDAGIQRAGIQWC